jgi:hypothetical protein
VIFFCPASPSFCNSPNLGIITHINCKIIIALIYGDNPIRIIEKLFIQPHISAEKNPKPLFSSLANIVTKPSVLTPGTGIVARILYTKTKSRVAIIFFLKFSILKIHLIDSNIFII